VIFLRVAMLQKTGESLGIEMYNQPKVFPSTLKAHTLLEFAGTKNDGEKQNDVAFWPCELGVWMMDKIKKKKKHVFLWFDILLAMRWRKNLLNTETPTQIL
jgi:hypothetical protein